MFVFIMSCHAYQHRYRTTSHKDNGRPNDTVFVFDYCFELGESNTAVPFVWRTEIRWGARRESTGEREGREQEAEEDRGAKCVQEKPTYRGPNMSTLWKTIPFNDRWAVVAVVVAAGGVICLLMSVSHSWKGTLLIALIMSSFVSASVEEEDDSTAACCSLCTGSKSPYDRQARKFVLWAVWVV